MIRGWCPTAWRPMAAGDGLLVRVRPKLGRLTNRMRHSGDCEPWKFGLTELFAALMRRKGLGRSS